MSREAAQRLVLAIDELFEYLNAEELADVPRLNILKQPQVRYLAKLDARVEGLRLCIPGLHYIPPLEGLDPKQCFGYTTIYMTNKVNSPNGVLSIQLSGHWLLRMEGLRTAAESYASQADEGKKTPPSQPDTADVRDLCKLLNRHGGKGKSLIDIARGFTGESTGSDKKARSLLRQARRYGHLWRRADK